MHTTSPLAENDGVKRYASLLSQAQEHLATKRYDQAIEASNQAIAIHSQGSDPRFIKGIALLEKKQYQQSEILFNEAITLDPTKHGSWAMRAQTYLCLSDNSTGDTISYYNNLALQGYKICSRLDPEEANYHEYQAIQYAKLNQHQNAADCYNKYFSLTTGSVDNHFDYAVSLSMLKRYEEAIAHCKQALALDNKHEPSLKLYKTICKQLNLTVDTVFDAAHTPCSTVTTTNILSSHGLLAQARLNYDHLLLQGQTQLRNKSYHDASLTFKKAIDLAPLLDNRYAWEGLSDACALLGHYHEALCYYHNVITHLSHAKTQDPTALQSLRVRFSATLAFLFPKNTIKTASEMETMLKFQSASSDMDEQNYQLAKDKLNILMMDPYTSSPVYPFALLLNANAHRLLGKFNESIALYDQYLNMVPYDMNARSLKDNVITLLEPFDIDTRYITESNKIELNKQKLTELMRELRIKISTVDLIWEHTQIHERVLQFLVHTYIIPDELLIDHKLDHLYHQAKSKLMLLDVIEISQLYCIHPTTIYLNDKTSYTAINRREFYHTGQISWHIADFISRALLTGAAGYLSGTNGDIVAKIHAIMIICAPQHIMFTHFSTMLCRSLKAHDSENDRLESLRSIQYLSTTDLTLCTTDIEENICKRRNLPDQYTRSGMRRATNTTVHSQTEMMQLAMAAAVHRMKPYKSSDKIQASTIKHIASSKFIDIPLDPFMAKMVTDVNKQTKVFQNPLSTSYAHILDMLKHLSKPDDFGQTKNLEYSYLERILTQNIKHLKNALKILPHPLLYKNLAISYWRYWHTLTRDLSNIMSQTNTDLDRAVLALDNYSLALSYGPDADTYLKRAEMLISLAILKTGIIKHRDLSVTYQGKVYTYSVIHKHYMSHGLLQLALNDFSSSKRIQGPFERISSHYHSQLLRFITSMELGDPKKVDLEQKEIAHTFLPDDVFMNLDVAQSRDDVLPILQHFQHLNKGEACTIS